MTNYKALRSLYSILYAVSIDNELWAKRGKILPRAVYSCLPLFGTSLGTLKRFNEASKLSVHCTLPRCKPSALTRTH